MFPPHLIRHTICPDITEMLLLWRKTTTNQQTKENLLPCSLTRRGHDLVGSVSVIINTTGVPENGDSNTDSTVKVTMGLTRPDVTLTVARM